MTKDVRLMEYGGACELKQYFFCPQYSVFVVLFVVVAGVCVCVWGGMVVEETEDGESKIECFK